MQVGPDPAPLLLAAATIRPRLRATSATSPAAYARVPARAATSSIAAASSAVHFSLTDPQPHVQIADRLAERLRYHDPATVHGRPRNHVDAGPGERDVRKT